MTEHLLIDLAIVLILGVGAQWLAWRLRLPSILLLLLAGFLAGPISGVIRPDDLLGELLFPIVSISVAIILFEGGLTLHLAELPQAGRVILRLISVGALVTWTVSALAARFILGFDWSLSILLGAILIVTGPTVIGPLLQQIRPKGQSGAILKWEGILIDPVGAVLAVLVFEIILAGDFNEAPSVILFGALQTIVIGLSLGTVGAALLVFLLRRYWIPDQLHNGVALIIAIAMFAVSNEIQPEAGLLTVTVMGVAVANQHWVAIKHIIEFKENLRVLLIGSLFILLAARLQLDDVLNLGWRGAAFLAVLIVLARPLSVLLSTWGTSVTRPERIFISWMAPRGIVAASVASLFAFELVEAGHSGAEKLVATTFLVIVGTVLLYGLTAGPLARRFGLAEQDPQGTLIVGAQPLARAIASAISAAGFRVLLVDTNEKNVQACKNENLPVVVGNALSEDILEDLDLTGIGRLLALTSNDEVNALAALHFPEIFSRADVYQLPIENARNADTRAAQYLTGRFLFDNNATFSFLETQLAHGATIASPRLAKDFDYVAFQSQYEDRALPLFLVTERRQLLIYSADFQPIPKPGQTLISLIPTATPLPDPVATEETST